MNALPTHLYFFVENYNGFKEEQALSNLLTFIVNSSNLF